MKHIYKKTRYGKDLWDQTPYWDVIYFGRSFNFSDMRLFDPTLFTKLEWRGIYGNSAWYMSRNCMIVWDKPKKEIIENWKRDGQIAMDTYKRRRVKVI